MYITGIFAQKISQNIIDVPVADPLNSNTDVDVNTAITDLSNFFGSNAQVQDVTKFKKLTFDLHVAMKRELPTGNCAFFMTRSVFIKDAQEATGFYSHSADPQFDFIRYRCYVGATLEAEAQNLIGLINGTKPCEDIPPVPSNGCNMTQAEFNTLYTKYIELYGSPVLKTVLDNNPCILRDLYAFPQYKPSSDWLNLGLGTSLGQIDRFLSRRFNEAFVFTLTRLLKLAENGGQIPPLEDQYWHNCRNTVYDNISDPILKNAMAFTIGMIIGLDEYKRYVTNIPNGNIEDLNLVLYKALFDEEMRTVLFRVFTENTYFGVLDAFNSTTNDLNTISKLDCPAAYLLGKRLTFMACSRFTPLGLMTTLATRDAIGGLMESTRDALFLSSLPYPLLVQVITTPQEYQLYNNGVLVAVYNRDGNIFTYINPSYINASSLTRKDNIQPLGCVAQGNCLGVDGLNYVVVQGGNPSATSCIVCQNYTACIKMDSVLIKTGNITNSQYQNALNRICNALNDDVKILSVALELLNDQYSQQDVQAFLNDVLQQQSTTQALGNNLAQLTPEIIRAWKLVNTARPRLNYCIDFKLLDQVRTMRANTTLMQTLGGDNVLTDIIRKNISAPCYTCANNKDYLEKMDEYLKSVAYFVTTFGKNQDGNRSAYVFSSGITAGTPTQSSFQRTGAIFVVKILNRDKSILPDIFEASYANVGQGSTQRGCEADARVGTKIYEFKSWSPNDEDVDIGSFGGDEYFVIGGTSMFQKLANNSLGSMPNAYTQFVCYLRNINSMNDLEYIFDKDLIVAKGIPNAEGYVKNFFKELLTRPQEQNDVFEVIWGNDPLRRDIWKDDVNFPDDPDADPDTKVQYKSKFATLTNNINNSIYNFIKVK